MLSRPQLTALRDRTHELAAQAHSNPAATELALTALDLLDALERAKTRETQLRATVAELVMACRASVASDRCGDPEPLVHVAHQLSAHGWMPSPDAKPATLLAATASVRDLLSSQPTP